MVGHLPGTNYEPHKIVMLFFFAAFLALNVLDVVTTFIAIVFHHLAELNPVGAYLMHQIGPLPGLIILKAFYVGIVSATIYALLHDIHSFVADDVMIAGLLILNILGLFVLSNNFGILGWPFFFHFRF